MVVYWWAIFRIFLITAHHIAMEEGERRFTRLSADSVRLCAENVGVQTTPEVSSALVDDVSFRIRQITDTATQFMRHAKRRRLMVEDFNNAIKWSGVEPLYGHQSSDSPQFSPDLQTGLFSVSDSEVRLEDIAHETPVESHTLSQPPSVSASWLSVEGVPLPRDCPDPPPEGMELKRASNESERSYMSLLMEAITGDNEDLRRIALNDIQHNTAVANILPDLFQYLQGTLGVWSKFTPVQLVRVLKLLLAILRNSSLFLDPYVSAVYPSMKTILLNVSYLITGDGSHWNMRQAAALTMAELLNRCGSPLNDYQSDLFTSFHQLLSRPSPPLPVLYGAVMTLCYSNGKNISDVLLPYMDAITTHIQGLLECGQPAVKDDALRVYETLLLAAELLLTSDVQLAPEQLPTSLNRDSPPTSGPHPPGGESSLFGNTSFGLSGAQSTMEEDGEELSGQREVMTLYDYLIDLFGERLSLRLVGHLADKTSHSSVKPPSNQNQSKDPYHHSRGNRSLILFLSQEGFKPVKVDLPHKVVPLRAPPGHYRSRQPCSFSIPQSVLPVRGNVLEAHKKRHRGENPSPPVVRGRGYGRKKDGGHSVDISSSWI